MSSDIRALRDLSNDPYGKFLADLSKKFSAFISKDQAELVENPEDVFADGQDFDSVLKYHNFVMTKLFDMQTEYYSAAETDYNNWTLMLGGPWPNLGERMIDASSFKNHATITGEPTLVDGAPFDIGLFDGTDNVKSLAARFNRPTSQYVNTEKMTIPDVANIQVLGISTGMSYFIRLKISSLVTQGALERTIFEKIDDNTPNNGAMLYVTSDGKLIFFVKLGGVLTAKQTAAGTIATDTVYDIWCTYAVTGPVVHIYVNNSDKTLSDYGGTTTWHTTLTNHDLTIFNRGAGSNGYLYGDFYTMRMAKEKVVSSTEVAQHYTNKLTTADIPLGQVPYSSLSCSVDV